MVNIKLKHAGFTLVELLVAMAIFGVLLVVVMSALNTGSKTLGTIISESEIIEETRAAADIIAYSIGEAAYVYPPGTTLKLNSSGYTTKNPKDGSHTWEVGTDPIVAMIMLPKITEDTDTCSAADTDFCYSFVAYYPVKRSVVVAQTENAYLEDPLNNDKWVLYEYKRYFDNIGPTTKDLVVLSNDGLPTVFSNSSGNILADYIVPNGNDTNIFLDIPNPATSCYSGFQEEIEEYNLSSACSGDPDDLSIYKSLGKGTFVFQAAKKHRGKTYKTPQASVPIAPFSLHNPVLDKTRYTSLF